MHPLRSQPLPRPPVAQTRGVSGDKLLSISSPSSSLPDLSSVLPNTPSGPITRPFFSASTRVPLASPVHAFFVCLSGGEGASNLRAAASESESPSLRVGLPFAFCPSASTHVHLLLGNIGSFMCKSSYSRGFDGPASSCS
ncbi:hypothetical protein GSI_04981 [Ganoderma sinense ZZ0214-1]|uniref:Uncharacterized protein n=1 Tax=Ganoderma sinense ZZ0214-1 TaxID=1077348 RepID=A0A2G8SGH9_9APHY|nr:hypothetical protein GSI_04981 [Ganoderma sinense ZZ0214-1]